MQTENRRTASRPPKGQQGSIRLGEEPRENIFQAENLPIKNVGLAERGGNLVQVVRRLEVDLPHHQQNPPPQIQRDLL